MIIPSSGEKKVNVTMREDVNLLDEVSVNAQNRSLGGAITNLNGQYNVKIPEGESNLTIVFSYIGMKTQRVKYAGQTNLNIRMESESKTVDEVVVSAKRIERNDLGITSKDPASHWHWSVPSGIAGFLHPARPAEHWCRRCVAAHEV